jgi:hypothetical protein
MMIGKKTIETHVDFGMDIRAYWLYTLEESGRVVRQYQHDNRKLHYRYYRTAFSCYDTVFSIVTALLRTQNRKHYIMQQDL